MLGEVGVPELLIKEVEDEAGNIIEVVVGQVSVPFDNTNYRVPCSRLFSIQSTS
jgi:hypothetical protein